MRSLEQIFHEHALDDKDEMLNLLSEFVQKKNLVADLDDFALEYESNKLEESLHYDEQKTGQGPCCQCGDSFHTCKNCDLE
jgi:hypothetical protein